MNVPESIGEQHGKLPGPDERIIPNEYAGQDLLTRGEAVHMIHLLTDMLYIDGVNRTEVFND